MNYISRDIYDKWKYETIKFFFNKKKCKHKLVPYGNNINCLIKDKIIIVLDIFRKKNKKLYSKIAKENKNIPEKHKISLYHSGNKKNGTVSVGFTTFSNEKQFLHPAIDFGGLTNYRQVLGKRAKFLKESPIRLGYNKPKKINNVVNRLYKLWKKNSNKKIFYGKVKANLKKVILSIYKNKILNKGDYINLRFYKLPNEKIKVMRSGLVIDKTGHYYNRLFNGDDNKYASDMKLRNLICGIAKKYITTNLNKNNLLNEYKLY